MLRRKQQGFTLIEMMVTIAIMLIGLAIAIPSYKAITTGVRMGNEINALAADVNFARSEAIKRGTNVTVNPTTAAGDWAGGWTVQDVNNVNLRIGSAVTQSDTLTGGTGSITFTPAGYASFTATITLHNAADDQNQRRCIVFATGTWSVKNGATCP